eukprot:CAMPEP_0116872726 /NCGR_PEP_ID=MMETSP0463-20121206/3558_1 /TAXON_ID=181622 /ORGANISM="Strombidinopsis sp, Strain SopsisLIS2011" /LENGTH=45 /DNA_ID= /DNA_START= /DNA_END= /DNA_ORIENTATION=
MTGYMRRDAVKELLLGDDDTASLAEEFSPKGLGAPFFLIRDGDGP